MGHVGQRGQQCTVTFVCVLEEHTAVAVGKDISHIASGALHPMRKDGAGRSRARGGKEGKELDGAGWSRLSETLQVCCGVLFLWCAGMEVRL